MDPSQLAGHLRFFQELGVLGISQDPRWRTRESASTSNSQLPTPHGTESTGTTVEDTEVGITHVAETAGPPKIWTLEAVREDIGDCTRCKLHTLGRRQIVFGVGNRNAELMFVGEGPGADEDIQGVPFVGRAGQLLTKMIEAMGFQRNDVYIANVVKCRPPENRNPEPDEIASCEPFLFRQIEAIKPQVIVALGSFAAKTLLKTTEPISRLRGHVFVYHGAQLVPTFHPSFLLRSPNQKKYAWDDLKKVLALMGRPVPSSAAGPEA